jgi:hypothetical protein
MKTSAGRNAEEAPVGIKTRHLAKRRLLLAPVLISVTAGNPVAMLPDRERVARAISTREFSVVAVVEPPASVRTDLQITQDLAARVSLAPCDSG